MHVGAWGPIKVPPGPGLGGHSGESFQLASAKTFGRRDSQHSDWPKVQTERVLPNSSADR
jgi:hypothetical protein